jgi:hypothetical protein
MDVMNDEAKPPVVRVVRGAPTPEELAALVGALLATRPTAADAAGPEPVSGWRVSMRPTIPLRHGSGAWRASGLPA